MLTVEKDEPPQPHTLATFTTITLLNYIAPTVDRVSLVKHHPRAQPIAQG